jgi:hypothetical protein
VSQSQGLLEAAQSPFIQGMSDAVQVGGVAAFTALLLLFGPARGKEQAPLREGVVEIETARMNGRP